MTSSYPLKWPEGWKRGQEKPPGSASRFMTTYDKTLRRLLAVLRRLGAASYVISSNLPLRQDGLPRADVARYRIDDPGVAVYFTRDGKQMVLARDAYDSVYDNLHSLTLALEHLALLERHGGAAMMERAFDGFMALPDQSNWRTILGFKRNDVVTLSDAEARYREGAKRCHADAGGDHEAMIKLNVAIQQAREELGK